MLFCVILSVFLSYCFSCLLEIGPYRKDWQNILRALKARPGAFLATILARTALVALFIHVETQLVRFVHVQAVNFQPWFGCLAALMAAAVIIFPSHWASLAVKRRVREQLSINRWQRVLLKLDRLGWGKIIWELWFIRAKQANLIWREEANRIPIFILFEENRDIIVKFHYKHRDKVGERTWLYLGLLAGDDNTKRAEALLTVFGYKWVIKEIKRYHAGRESIIPVSQDRRINPAGLISRPDPQKLLESRRRADRLVGEILMDFAKQT